MNDDSKVLSKFAKYEVLEFEKRIRADQKRKDIKTLSKKAFTESILQKINNEINDELESAKNDFAITRGLKTGEQQEHWCDEYIRMNYQNFIVDAIKEAIAELDEEKVEK